jgi:hypothetical protein
MDFSWPMIECLLGNIQHTGFYKSQHEVGTVRKSKCIGYFMERIFVIWAMLFEKSINYVVPEMVIWHRNPG